MYNEPGCLGLLLRGICEIKLYERDLAPCVRLSVRPSASKNIRHLEICKKNYKAMFKLWCLVLILCLICTDFIIKMQIKSHHKEIRQYQSTFTQMLYLSAVLRYLLYTFLEYFWFSEGNIVLLTSLAFSYYHLSDRFSYSSPLNLIVFVKNSY